MKRFCVFVFLSLLHTTSAMEQFDTQSDETNVLMPVCESTTDNRAVNLSVQIPDYFRLLQQTNSRCLEFIPKTDTDEYQWSEIVAVQSFAKLPVIAEKIVHNLCRGLQQGATRVQVLENSVSSYSKYKVATLRIAYTVAGFRKLLHAHYFSGPCNCSGVQYAVNCSGISEEEATLKIYRFLRSQVEVDDMPLYTALKKLETTK